MLQMYRDFSQGWYLTILSSLLCVLGCFIIYLDDVYELVFPTWFTSRHPFHLKENYAFMNGSLAFSAGCLLLTALYRLLPEALAYFTKLAGPDTNPNVVLMASFVGGICACCAFNVGLHLLTAESVVHCSHDGEDKMEQVRYRELQHQHTHGATDEDHTHSHSHAHSHSHLELTLAAHDDAEASRAPTAEMLELAPLLSRKKSTLAHYLAPKGDDALLGECKGYLSAELCLHDKKRGLHFCEIPQFHDEEGSSADEPAEAEHDTRRLMELHSQHLGSEHHHHHVHSPLLRLLLIGIQTILAITLHKLPEGFITYVTSETNPQLGLLIFFSLLIHNYTEGFLMCLPLYYSFGKSRWRKLKAVSVSALLGGLSQPLGALFGYIFMSTYGDDSLDLAKLNYVFGISMAVTAGFLTVIALSMYGLAVSFSGLPNRVMAWSLIGMGVIGVSSIFTKH